MSGLCCIRLNLQYLGTVLLVFAMLQYSRTTVEVSTDIAVSEATNIRPESYAVSLTSNTNSVWKQINCCSIKILLYLFQPLGQIFPQILILSMTHVNL